MLIPLKKYINNWLKSFTVRDIFTGELKYAKKLFKWDKSYFLKVLIQEKYYIDTDIDFVTKDKDYTKVIKTPLSQISAKKVKKYREVKRVIPEEIIENVIDYVPITVRKYRLVNDYDNPIYDTIIKKRKIGKKYYITTQYIPTGKYRKKREYYEDYKYVRKIRAKKRTVYKTVKVLEPYYEQVRERTKEDIKTKVTEYRFFEPFFVFDYYRKLDTDKYDHYIYIAPFFDGYGSAVKLGSDEDEIIGHRRLPKFITPQELTKTDMFQTAYKKCRFMIAEGKPKLYKKYFREINERINNNMEMHTVNLRDSNLYSLDIIDTGNDGIIFFKSADILDNSKTKII